MLTVYDIEYNNRRACDFGVFLQEYPKFSGAKKDYTTTSIQGRRGQLVSTDNYVENLTISCVFAVISPIFENTIRSLRIWLSGSGIMRFSGSPNIFYKVVKIEHDSLERELRTYGTFTVNFICDPFEYLDSGQIIVSSVTYNSFSTSHPIYYISGSGSFSLMVNGNVMTGVSNPDIVVDTEKMMAYRYDGTIQNVAVSGDYEKLYLVPGENTISITPDTFDLHIKPNWGYEL